MTENHTAEISTSVSLFFNGIKRKPLLNSIPFNSLSLGFAVFFSVAAIVLISLAYWPLPYTPQPNLISLSSATNKREALNNYSIILKHYPHSIKPTLKEAGNRQQFRATDICWNEIPSAVVNPMTHSGNTPLRSTLSISHQASYSGIFVILNHIDILS